MIELAMNDTDVDGIFWSKPEDWHGLKDVKLGYDKEGNQKMANTYGIDFYEMTQCPACDKVESMSAIIAHLSNEPDTICNKGAHDWSFKQIGEWLKTLGHQMKSKTIEEKIADEVKYGFPLDNLSKKQYK